MVVRFSHMDIARCTRALLPFVIAGLVAITSTLALAQSDPGCGGETIPCQIADGSGGQYYVMPPRGWDGVSPLPVLMFFHGYGATGQVFVKSQNMQRIARRGGFLLVAPDGLNKTWAHQGSPSNLRNEMAYVDALLADLKQRFPIDDRRMWAGGFSQGGSMVWDLACKRGDLFQAYVPIAGGFWNPMPTNCPAGPVNILHIHGLQDSTVPMEGRPIGSSWHQGDIRLGFEVWKQEAGCSVRPQRSDSRGRLRCDKWTTCTSGKTLALCLHDGGHSLPQGWSDEAYRFLNSL